jgi:endonuclease/exonuclease/phosphatase family metal-dependent hydrolase
VTGGRELTLASLNLHGGRTDRGEPFDVTAACTSLAADVIALQETWRTGAGPDPVTEAAHVLGGRAIHAGLQPGITLGMLNIASDPSTGTWGLAVITTLPVAGYEVASLGRAPGDRLPRDAQLVTLGLPGGGRLRIANAHLTHRLTSPVQLVKLRLLLADGGAPTVIAGDLNMPGPLTGLAAGFCPLVGGRTFPARRPLIQLDHLLAGEGVAGRGGEVLPPVGSDHLPVRARLTVPG